MQIVCPHCDASYSVKPESLGASGRQVRCVTCQGVWFAAPEPVYETEELPAAPDNGWRPIERRLDDVVAIPAGGSASDYDETATGLDQAIALERGPSIIPADDVAHVHRYDDGVPHDIESQAARRMARQKRSRWRIRLKPSLPVMIGAMAAALICLVLGRHQVVQVLPQTASLYAALGLPVNLRGLAFDNIRTVRETEDGVPVLVVEGDITGTTGRLTDVPRLRFGVVDSAGKEIYAWTARPARTLLPPGETLNFRSRLASPPADAANITVRFFNRRDAQSGFM